MGDIMILNEKEVQICLEFALEPLLKNYSIKMKEAQLSIDKKINIQSTILYQDHILDLKASFLLNYHHDQLCFDDIEGKVEYLFLQLNLMSVLKQLIKHDAVKITDHSCYYHCHLPIQNITIKDHSLEIQLQ